MKPESGQSMGKKQSITITEIQTGRIMNMSKNNSNSSLCSWARKQRDHENRGWKEMQ